MSRSPESGVRQDATDPKDFVVHGLEGLRKGKGNVNDKCMTLRGKGIHALVHGSAIQDECSKPTLALSCLLYFLIDVCGGGELVGSREGGNEQIDSCTEVFPVRPCAARFSRRRGMGWVSISEIYTG